MYAWFIKGLRPMEAMNRLFRNPACNLHEFWRLGGLYFRWCRRGGELCGDEGTLVTDEPNDTLLYPKRHRKHPEMQFSFKPTTVTIGGRKAPDGLAWYGVKKSVQEHRQIVVPPMIARPGKVVMIKA